MTKFDPLHPVPCVYWKHGAYWLVKRGKWERIGSGLEETLAEYARREQAPKGGMPDLIDKVFRHHSPKLAASTRQQYRHAADILKRKLVQFSPEQVKGKHIAGIKVSLVERPNMANRVLSFARIVFAYAAEWQVVDGNPCVGVKRYVEARRKRLLSSAEWWAIHERAGPRLRAIMKVAFLTGQRINDVLGIRRSQLTEAGVEFKQQKTGARLVVKWSPDLRAAIAEALALHRGVPALTLFLGRHGKPPNYRSVLLQWHEACAAAGVEDALPNDQRAQSITAARREGKNPTALAGHTLPAMTERYLRDREAPEVDGPTLRQALDVGQKGA